MLRSSGLPIFGASRDTDSRKLCANGVAILRPVLYWMLILGVGTWRICMDLTELVLVWQL